MSKDRPFGTLAGRWMACMTSSLRVRIAPRTTERPSQSTKRGTGDPRIDLNQTLRTGRLGVSSNSQPISRHFPTSCD